MMKVTVVDQVCEAADGAADEEQAIRETGLEEEQVATRSVTGKRREGGNAVDRGHKERGEAALAGGAACIVLMHKR